MFLFYCFCHLVLSHRFSTKPREIGLLGSRSHSKASTGCPIEIEQVPQVNLSSTVGGGKSIIFRVFRAVGRMVVRVGV